MNKNATLVPVLRDTDIADMRLAAEDIGYFMSSPFQNAECEVIAVQTLHASLANYEEHGQAFSYEDANVRRNDYMSGVRNGEGLGRLIHEGYIIESEFDGKPTLVVTRALIDLMLEHIAAKRRRR